MGLGSVSPIDDERQRALGWERQPPRQPITGGRQSTHVGDWARVITGVGRAVGETVDGLAVLRPHSEPDQRGALAIRCEHIVESEWTRES